MTNNIYTFVCDPDECDALVEFIPSDGFGFPNGEVKMTCACGRQMHWVSAKISPTNEKEKEMEYTPSSRITLRSTDYTTGAHTDTSYSTFDLEEIIRKNNLLEQRINSHEKMISQIKESLTLEGWYAESTDKADVLADLCSIVGHEPIATLRFSATITVEGSVDVPLSEVDEFDLRYELNDDITLDSHNGNMEIDAYYVDDITNQEWE